MSILPPIPKMSQLAPGVIRFLGMNPSPMTLQGTNSYLIGTPASKTRLLIDTSNPGRKDYIENVHQYLQNQCDNQPKISDIILTHWHPDHVGSVPDILALAESLQWPKPNVLKFPCKSHVVPDIIDLKDNQTIDLTKFGMGSLEILFTPGHTDDHICLLLKPENIVFSGDLILGNGSTTFEDLVLYMESLHRLQKIDKTISKIFPGHGVEIAEPIPKINEYIQHRLERINQVAKALIVDNWQSEMDIVVKVYDKAIIDDPVLFMGAMKNQYQALKYLLNEHHAEARECTPAEREHQRYSLSDKMWRSSVGDRPTKL